MKKILAIILSIIYLIFAVGWSLFPEKVTNTIQERDGLTYIPNETTPFTGVYIPTYPNGQKKEERNVKDGKEEGLTINWFENGQKQAEVNYKNGELEGLATRWLENGQKQAERNKKQEAVGKLIQDFEEKINDFFSFVRSDKDGERLIAKIKSQVQEDEIYSDFAIIYRRYRALHRKKVGDYFFKETEDLVNKLCDDFENEVLKTRCT